MVTQYVVLLRGINVGGKNIIKMADLKSCLEKAGFTNVATYIQSGNVLLESSETDVAKLTEQLQKLLTKEFGYDSRLVVLSHAQLAAAIAEAPKGFGKNAEQYKYDVIFVKQPLKAVDTLPQISLREGVDEVAAGSHALYFTRLTAQITKSHVGRIIGTPMYQNMTIRNWNTTSKLSALMDARAEAAKFAGK